MEITSILSSGAAGGLFGIIGSVGGRLIGIWETREKRKDTQLSYQHELNLIDLQAKARAIETEHELDILEQKLVQTTTEGSWNGLVESIKAQAALDGVTPWVKDVLALVRPGLTILLVVCMISTTVWLSNTGIRPATYDAIIADALNNITFMATTALLWWFGDRVPTHPGKMGGAR